MTLAERLKAIRAREGVTQAVLCAEVGLSISTYKKYESNLRLEVSLPGVQKIAAHPRYEKYALWLLLGYLPEQAQISAP